MLKFSYNQLKMIRNKKMVEHPILKKVNLAYYQFYTLNTVKESPSSNLEAKTIFIPSKQLIKKKLKS